MFSLTYKTKIVYMKRHQRRTRVKVKNKKKIHAKNKNKIKILKGQNQETKVHSTVAHPPISLPHQDHLFFSFSFYFPIKFYYYIQMSGVIILLLLIFHLGFPLPLKACMATLISFSGTVIIKNLTLLTKIFPFFFHFLISNPKKI